MKITNVLFVGTGFSEIESRIEPYLGFGAQIELHSVTTLKEAENRYQASPDFFEAVVVEGTRRNVAWAQGIWSRGVKVIVLAADYSCVELDYLPPRAGNFVTRLLRMLT